MTGIVSGGESSGKGGLFLRLIFPMVLLTLGAGLFSFVSARHAEEVRNRERIHSIARSNARLCEKLGLPRSSRLAGELSTTAGVTILFAGPEGELISAIPLSESQRKLAWRALADPGSVPESEGTQAVASLLSTVLPEGLIVLHESPHAGFFETRSLTPSLLCGLFLALGAAFFISRSVVIPLRAIARETRETPDDRPLRLPSRLLKRRDEIGRLARELVDRRMQLLSEQEKRRRVERLALLGQITTSLAHEIKNPAASIIMQGQQLEAGGEGPAGRLIREEAERIASLVDQWLFVAKPDGPQAKAHDLSAQVRGLLEKMKPLMGFYRVTAVLSAPESLVIPCDPKRLEHVFRNLLDNAIQAMPQGGCIEIRLEDGEDRVVFSICDEGDGFSENALAHFGEAFYSEKEGGFGLGLTLVCGVMEAHHGGIEAENVPEGGALVRGFLLKAQPQEIA